MIIKARPCKKLTGMIDSDHLPTSHVSTSHQNVHIMHEMIMLVILVDGARRGARHMKNV